MSRTISLERGQRPGLAHHLWRFRWYRRLVARKVRHEGRLVRCWLRMVNATWPTASRAIIAEMVSRMP